MFPHAAFPAPKNGQLKTGETEKTRKRPPPIKTQKVPSKSAKITVKSLQVWQAYIRVRSGGEIYFGQQCKAVIGTLGSRTLVSGHRQKIVLRSNTGAPSSQVPSSTPVQGRNLVPGHSACALILV